VASGSPDDVVVAGAVVVVVVGVVVDVDAVPVAAVHAGVVYLFEKCGRVQDPCAWFELGV